MHNIAIIGAGVAGLQLALYLQQNGITATIITERQPEDYRRARLQNTVAHHAVTLQREQQLAVNHWPQPEFHYFYHDHWVNLPQPMHFRGNFVKPSRAVDYRLYLPALMDDFVNRGGNIEYRLIDADDIPQLIERFDLLVVAAGRGALASMFVHDPEHSPYQQPQRRLSVGLYTGVSHPDPKNVTISITPGQGELLVIPTLTLSGMQTALLLENVPGAGLEQTVTQRYADNPKAFLQLVLDKLEQYHPATYHRIDTTRFDLAQPQDLIQGGFAPVVRKSVVEFDNGKFAVALGDAHVALDPVNGQGANIASHAAFVMGEEIVKTARLDRKFLERVNMRRQARVLGASRWTNLSLHPPKEFMALLQAMNEFPALCNEFTENFNAPEKQWERLRSPENIRSWIDQFHA